MTDVNIASGLALFDRANRAMNTFASEALTKKFSQLRNEFARLKKFVPDLKECSAFSKFDGENSNSYWLHYPCLDKTRVVLLNKDTDEAAYIHANYVRDPPLPINYIAALAPELETVDNFVTLIWQEGVEKVVMLCRLQEIEWRKSEDYYPRIVGQEHNISGISVKCLERRTLEE
uniref:Tyrosine-protein phosphatase domain-containing protein n=1 Tax=Plectus sambesii TaxID=2011161 RepID=A0A914UU68_9BILA